jgi:hypothetical protein
MNLDLASNDDRFRLTFDGADQAVNFNMLVFSNADAQRSSTGCWIPATAKPFSVDIPLAAFTPGGNTQGADFHVISKILLEFDGAQGPPSGEDWAVTSFEAIPIGAPPADTTCPPRGH